MMFGLNLSYLSEVFILSSYVFTALVLALLFSASVLSIHPIQIYGPFHYTHFVGSPSPKCCYHTLPLHLEMFV